MRITLIVGYVSMLCDSADSSHISTPRLPLLRMCSGDGMSRGVDLYVWSLVLQQLGCFHMVGVHAEEANDSPSRILWETGY
jgi:hypothetical protein